MKPEARKKGWITFAFVALCIAGYLVYHYGYLVYQEYDYYTHYEDIHGLQRSNPVLINGVRVGEVSDIITTGKDNVRVTLSINKKTQIAEGTVAILSSEGLLGNMSIQLEMGNGPGIYTHKDVLKGKYDTSVMDMSDRIDPIVESVKYILGTADKNFSNFNRKIENGYVEKAQKDVITLERNIDGFSKQASEIGKSADKVLNTIRQLRVQSDKIAGGNNARTKSIIDADSATARFAREPITQTLTDLRNTVSNAKQEAAKIETISAKDVLENDKLYKNSTKSLQEVNEDLKEVKDNPKGISLIGGD